MLWFCLIFLKHTGANTQIGLFGSPRLSRCGFHNCDDGSEEIA